MVRALIARCHCEERSDMAFQHVSLWRSFIGIPSEVEGS